MPVPHRPPRSFQSTSRECVSTRSCGFQVVVASSIYRYRNINKILMDAKLAKLLVLRRDNAMLNGVVGQLGGGAQSKLPHNAVLMEFHRS